MTIITIALSQGENFISFPATSNDNFETIFTNSEVINHIVQNGFIKFNPIMNAFENVNLTRYIEKGVGYDIIVDTSGLNITYDGTEYNLSFAQLSSNLLPGWNLIGSGSNLVKPLDWCRVLDPVDYYSNIITTLFPTKAYWVFQSNCTKPTINISSLVFMFGEIGTVLFTIYLLRKFKIIGKPMD
jgi:hypothetical protein